MGQLVYLTNVSLEILIEDEHGSLGCIWAAATRETSR
jgi:hypothetical protein